MNILRADLEAAYFRMLKRCQRAANGCVVFTGAKNKNGYGNVIVKKPNGSRTVMNAHRISFLFWNAAPEGRFDVRHGCDTPACMFHDCLTPGTHKENFYDMVERKRITRDKRGFAKVELSDAPF